MINFFEDGLDRNRVYDCFTTLNEGAESDYDNEVELIGDIDFEKLLGSGDPHFTRIASFGDDTHSHVTDSSLASPSSSTRRDRLCTVMSDIASIRLIN
jgi:hypothetical protein